MPPAQIGLFKVIRAAGLWFSMQRLGDGVVDYEFFHRDILLERGVCEEDEMFRR
jgi:hypothetical protein